MILEVPIDGRLSGPEDRFSSMLTFSNFLNSLVILHLVGVGAPLCILKVTRRKSYQQSGATVLRQRMCAIALLVSRR